MSTCLVKRVSSRLRTFQREMHDASRRTRTGRSTAYGGQDREGTSALDDHVALRRSSHEASHCPESIRRPHHVRRQPLRSPHGVPRPQENEVTASNRAESNETLCTVWDLMPESCLLIAFVARYEEASRTTRTGRRARLAEQRLKVRQIPESVRRPGHVLEDASVSVRHAASIGRRGRTQ